MYWLPWCTAAWFVSRRAGFVVEPGGGRAALITAGTSDLPVADEARMLLEATGVEARLVFVVPNGIPDEAGRFAREPREVPGVLFVGVHLESKGVVVLADIGSAILSVRAVLNDGMADGVTAVLADAPLVEGAIAAAVTASIGGDVEAVRAAAEEAWNVRKL